MFSWWHHQMETFSALMALCEGNSPVTSEFPSQRPVMRSLGVFFDLRLNKRFSEQSWGWWFEMPCHLLWRHYNVAIYYILFLWDTFFRAKFSVFTVFMCKKMELLQFYFQIKSIHIDHEQKLLIKNHSQITLGPMDWCSCLFPRFFFQESDFSLHQ